MKTTVRILRVVESDELPIFDVPAPAPLPEPAPAPLATPEPTATPVSEPAIGRSRSGRLFALVLLAATAGAIAWIATTAYHVVTDAWVAPLHLSRDNDSIAQLRVAQQRNLAEISRLEAEVTRLDGELGAIDTAVAKLAALRDSAKRTIDWQTAQSKVEATGLSDQLHIMRRQLASLRDLHTRQLALVAKARADLAAGLIDRSVVDREEQTRDGFVVEIQELQRQIAETSLRGNQTHTVLAGLRDHAGGMPEVETGDEHTARIDVEITRLEAEARGDRAERDAAKAAVSTERQLLQELQARPLYRAMDQTTDIAFVPYTQLDKLHAGAEIISCTWSVFDCHAVGHVSEVVPGEVVTQDPWGELARGQYAVLNLDDKDAIKERVLRVR